MAMEISLLLRTTPEQQHVPMMNLTEFLLNLFQMLELSAMNMILLV